MDLFDFEQSVAENAKIKVVGVGGGGGNAVQNMITSGLRGVTFICANTDVQALNKSAAPYRVQLGEQLTRGLGAGANPEKGREAALESVSAIKESLEGADMVFVTAGMGGGTGTGAAPVIAQAARELGALTVGVVTKPFTFEGSKRKNAAEAGLQELRQHVDCLITIPNDRLLQFAPKKAPFTEMLRKANDVLFYAVKGISDVIMQEGLINVDFADVTTIMQESGIALMGTGIASGENRARDAAHAAITSPLLEDVSLDGAKAVLYNITASTDISGEEISEIGEIISQAAHTDANIIFGVVFDEDAGDVLRITVVATGIDKTHRLEVEEPEQHATVTNFKQPTPAAVSPQQSMRRQAEPEPQHNMPPMSNMGEEGHMRRRMPVENWHDGGKGDLPSYLRKGQAMGANQMQRTHSPGSEEFIFDENEYDMPAFIRRQAD